LFIFLFNILYLTFFSKSSAKSKNKDPFLIFLQKRNKLITEIKPDHIEFVFKEIFKGLSFSFLPETFTEKTNINNPEMNLFFWCVLSNRLEIAKTFWRLGKVKIDLFDDIKEFITI
jgi:hypothetical protein